MRKLSREILLASAITLAALSFLVMSRDKTEIASAPSEASARSTQH